MQTKIKEIRKSLLEHFRGNDEIVDMFLAGVVSRANILIMSSHGRGKSHLAETTAKLLKTTYSRVQGSQGLTESKFMAKYDIAKLLKGEEHVQWRDFVTAQIKFIDEINRCHPTVLNSMFSLMAEHIAVFGDSRVEIPKFTMVATMNPSDDGTYQLPAPMVDRFDVCMNLPSLTFQDKLKVIDLQQKPVVPVLAEGELDKIWAEVESSVLPNIFTIKATTMVRDLQLCEHGDKEMLTDFPLCCKECRHESGVCSKIDCRSPVSERAYLSAIRMMKGLQYIKGKVTNDDLKTVMKYVLLHRTKMVPAFEKKIPNRMNAMVSIVDSLARMDYQRKNAYEIIAKIGQGMGKIGDLDDYANNDMFIRELRENLKNRVKDMEAAYNLNDATPEKIEKMIKDVESGKIPADNKTLVLESLRTKLIPYLNREIKFLKDDWPKFIGILEANGSSLGKNLRANLSKSDMNVVSDGIEFNYVRTKTGYQANFKADSLTRAREIMKMARKAKSEVDKDDN